MVIKQPPNIHDIKAMDAEESKTEGVNADDPDEGDNDDKESPDSRSTRCGCLSRVCPPRGKAADVLTYAAILVTLWAVSMMIMMTIMMIITVMVMIMMMVMMVMMLTMVQVSYCVLGEVALPGHHHIHVTIEGGTLFSLLVMFTVSSIAGWAVTFLQLPPLLGMLLTGILLRYCSLLG